MADNVSGYSQRCSYCLNAVDKTNLKSCSGCRMVRYCSRACQENAWPTHRASCATGGDFKDSLDQRSKKLNHSFTKFLDYYRPLICMTAPSAFNLANSSPDKLATHCMYVVLEQQPAAQAAPFYFKMVSGQIISRREMVDVFNSLDMTQEQIDGWARDDRGDHTVHIVFQFAAMCRFLWFSLHDIGGYRSMNPDIANKLANEWADALAAAMNIGYAGPGTSSR